MCWIWSSCWWRSWSNWMVSWPKEMWNCRGECWLGFLRSLDLFVCTPNCNLFAYSLGLDLELINQNNIRHWFQFWGEVNGMVDIPSVIAIWVASKRSHYFDLLIVAPFHSRNFIKTFFFFVLFFFFCFWCRWGECRSMWRHSTCSRSGMPCPTGQMGKWRSRRREILWLWPQNGRPLIPHQLHQALPTTPSLIGNFLSKSYSLCVYNDTYIHITWAVCELCFFVCLGFSLSLLFYSLLYLDCEGSYFSCLSLSLLIHHNHK